MKLLSVLTVGLIATFLGLTLVGCSASTTKKKQKVETAPTARFGPPKQVGEITAKEIDEGSGIAASKCQPAVFWTHNDANNKGQLFAIKTTGEVLGIWHVENAENEDWEDIASFRDESGQCFLFIGDIGDNDGKRVDHAIYKFKEPLMPAGDATPDPKDPIHTEPAERLNYNYGGTSPNAETLLVHPKTADLYVISKDEKNPAVVYAIKGTFGAPEAVKAQQIGALSLPSSPIGQATGGSISPDGRYLVIMDYSGAYEFSLPDGSVNFNDIWTQTPHTLNLGDLKHGEGICYSADGSHIFAIRDGKKSPIVQLDLKR